MKLLVAYNFDTLARVAAEEGRIAPNDLEKLAAFRSNPKDEGWMRV